MSKNQYDQEAAPAKNALQNYVDQGNNFQSADDIFIKLTSTKLQSIKASFIEFDKTIMLLKGKKMLGIDKYNSYQFAQQGMKAWQYYQIGVGLLISFDAYLSFKPGVQVIQSFDPCKGSLVSSTRNAKRKDHQINNLFSCRHRNCPQSFVTLEELEDHMTKGIPQIPTVKAGMDLVKKIIF